MIALRRRLFSLDALWLGFWGCLSSVLIVSASSRMSGTFDEAFYLRAGLNHWRTGSTFELMRYGTMPLPVDVATAPLYMCEQAFGTRWNLDSDYGDALRIARCGTLVFWWLLLVAGFLLARELGGPWAGRLAIVIFSLEPNLLAHAGLATTDIAHTACLLFFCVAYRAGRDQNWLRRIVVPGLAAGLTLLAKASALAFVPICILAIESCRLFASNSDVPFWTNARSALAHFVSRRFRWEFFWTGCIALCATYLYCGSDWQTHPKLIEAAHHVPEGPARMIAIWFAEHLAIFNNAGVGLCYQIQHNMRAHGAYLLGESTDTSFWNYFPIVLSMKLPLLLLAAPLLLVVAIRFKALNWISLAAAIMLAFSLNCRVQIGVRLQIPLIVFLCLGVACSMATWIRADSMRHWRIAVAAIALAALAVPTIRAWPNWISYSNGLWGDPNSGELLLSDSNFDWGQGLKELDDWRRDRGIDEMSVWYFGTDPAAMRHPFRYAPLHTVDVRDKEDLRPKLPTRYLAVGTTILYGNYIREPAWLLAKLRSAKPIGRTRTFLVFDCGYQDR